MILKLRWLVLVLWLVALVALVAAAPDMKQLVRDKGQITVPDGYSSTMAAELLKEMKRGSGAAEAANAGSSRTSVLVLHNENGLNEADDQQMKRAVELLKQGKERYGITSVTTHLDTPELKEQLVAKDGRTALMLVEAELGGRTPAELREGLYEALSDVQVDHYYTGNWLIQEDVIESSEEGLKKTEWITLVFILAILLVVFRSPVAPFIPLLTVGITYIVSQSIVAFLVDTVSFPLSNFTQIFLVAVLFGIGTDYCILLISRFKEELVRSGGDRVEAIVASYRTAGRTVFYAGLAVMVGFASIGFSTFVLYRSAVAVAVGVAVLLLALMTLVPFFMMVLGPKLFWPVKGSLEHKPSKLWDTVGRFSLKRPLTALLIVAAVTVPFLSVYEGSTSFNSLDEIGDKYRSVKAFNVISDSFGPGDSLPSTIVMRKSDGWAGTAGLAAVEQVSRELAAVDGVKLVRSATRPTGEPIGEFEVGKQAAALEDGLGEGSDGLSKVGSGLSEASSQLSDNAPKLQEAVSGADELVAGTTELKQGVDELASGLLQLQKGLADGSAGAGELEAGLAEAQASAEQLAAGSRQLQASYEQLGGGLGQLTEAYVQVAGQSQSLAQGLADAGLGMQGLAVKYPDLQQDPDYLKLQAAMKQLQSGAEQLSAGLGELNAQLAGVEQGLSQANSGYKQAAEGQVQLAAGLGALAQGMSELQSGIAKAADGQGAIVKKLPELSGGLEQLSSGQKELQQGFVQLNEQLGELTSGLQSSVDGLKQLEDGLKSAQGYLDGLSSPSNGQLSGWYAPEEALSDASFVQALDTYMSADRTLMKLDVVFSGNPYDAATMAKVDDLKAAVERAVRTAGLANVTFAIDGVSSSNHDLKTISDADYSRTAVLMLVGIGLILIVMFRSIVIPIYITLSLVLTFFTSMAITEVIYVDLLGFAGISWAVPFFGFVLLMALGVDYSIFLMDRFKEYRHLPPREAILEAMRSMGAVIVSAAVILGGTFAAMLPSGVMSLLQIATIVLCGLFLYAFIMLPLFVPVMVRTFGEANWWPFMRKTERDVD